MSDNTASPTGTGKIVEALVELTKQTRETKTLLSDVMTQRTEFTAQFNDFKASIDTTRRALDPEQLGAHVAQNNDAFMGDLTQKFAKGLQINLDAADANLKAANQTDDAAQTLTNLDMQANRLSGITERLEERDKRSK